MTFFYSPNANNKRLLLRNGENAAQGKSTVYLSDMLCPPFREHLFESKHTI
ncbi:hypothetical protein Q672_14995 [Marinobacter sp. EVN1]|nr:hypothetical protein Q672_14995 [Marinobacter sp. EVN1]